MTDTLSAKQENKSSRVFQYTHGFEKLCYEFTTRHYTNFTYGLLVLSQQTLFVAHTRGTWGRPQQVVCTETLVHFPEIESL